MKIKRTSLETQVSIQGSQTLSINTGSGFFDHMLHQFFKAFDTPVELIVIGDTQTGFHHSLEDLGYVIGRWIRTGYEASPVLRTSHTKQVMDEACLDLVIDLSGRCTCVLEGLNHNLPLPGGLTTSDVIAFLLAMCQEGLLTLHVDVIRGQDTHNILEALFRGLGRITAQALTPQSGAMSTKGKVTWEVSL